MTPRTIYIAVAVSEEYLDPLRVLLHSALGRLASGWSLEVFVLGFEISEGSRDRVAANLRGLPVHLTWKTVDLSAIRDCWPRIRHPAEETCYYRIFLADVLPAAVDRVLFLDADLLVESDLTELWRQPFDGHLALAVVDAFSLPAHATRLSGVAFEEPVRFTESSSYFNAGVMLIDLRRWREERISQRASAFLWKHGKQMVYRDQDALNCALFGRWKPLSPKWNLHFVANSTLDWAAPGASADELAELRAPAVIHFAGKKPWSDGLRPPGSRRWWKVARAAGVPEVRRHWTVVLQDFLLWRPHCHLRWLLLRGAWVSALHHVLFRPWIAATYPFWKRSLRPRQSSIRRGGD